jgi:Tfp pilus assembly protein PilN
MIKRYCDDNLLDWLASECFPHKSTFFLYLYAGTGTANTVLTHTVGSRRYQVLGTSNGRERKAMLLEEKKRKR